MTPIMQILLDADFPLELLLNRNNLVINAEKAYKLLCSSPQIRGYLTSSGLEKIYSMFLDIYGSEVAEQIINAIKEEIEICQVNPFIIDKARLLNIEDAESAVEVASALANNIWSILTLYPKHFIGTDLQILSIEKFFDRQSLESQLLYIPEPRVNQKNLEVIKSLSKSYQKPIQLTNWLENDFEEAFQSNWQLVADIFEKKQPTYRYRYAAMRMQWSKLAKKIDLGNGCLMALVIQVALNQLNKVDILLQLYALNKTKPLPNNTELIILNDFENEFISTKSLPNNIGIQLAFQGDFGDYFLVKIIQNRNRLIESFIV